MKLFFLPLVAGLLIVFFAFTFFRPVPADPHVVPVPSAGLASSSPGGGVSVTGDAQPFAPVQPSSGSVAGRIEGEVVAAPAVEAAVPLTPAAKAAALETMHEAMVSYDPAKLPGIVAYLNHPDEELREAALDNILQMGEAAAAPLLRKASEKARSPKEALAMLDAADFLELPPANLRAESAAAGGAAGKPGP